MFCSQLDAVKLLRNCSFMEQLSDCVTFTSQACTISPLGQREWSIINLNSCVLAKAQAREKKYLLPFCADTTT